ncbi:site-specific integrase [Burkholderia gladioli]|uniref:site-specific integrase n=1 Tax=Burkholderia gladioli TaxID=28095 RepID=UPI001FC88425|nr:site-specific integrase [Burkholderia gladioli]
MTFDTEEEGDAYVARIEQLLDAGIVPEDVVNQRQSIVTVDDAIREYLRRVSIPQSDVKLLNVLLDRVKGVSLVRLDYAWAEKWVAEMKRRENLSPSTIRHYTGALARCLDWICKSGTPLLAVNPLRQLPKRYAAYTDEDAKAAEAQGRKPRKDLHRDRRPSAVEEAEIRRILGGGKPEGRERAFELQYAPALNCLFDLAIESAMRLREMFTLSPAQIDIDRRTVALDRTKNGSKRPVPLTTVALAAYTRYIDIVSSGDPAMAGFTLKSGYVFPWVPDAERAMLAGDKLLLAAKVMDRVTARLSQQFGRIFAAAGCPDLVFHDLRHEATSRFYERTTLTDIQIAKITGHADPKVLLRYANLRGSDLAERLW